MIKSSIKYDIYESKEDNSLSSKYSAKTLEEIVQYLLNNPSNNLWVVETGTYINTNTGHYEVIARRI